MTQPTFTNLWPTQFMEIMLPGHDQANPILIDHIETLDRQKAQMTTGGNRGGNQECARTDILS